MTPQSELNYCTIPLTKGQVAIIDADDFPFVRGPKWQAFEYAPGRFYATRKVWENGKQLVVYMHRHLLGLKRGDPRMGEHANLNGLDNRRSENLRIATKSQNMMNCGRRKDNKSGVKNVFYDTRSRRWKSYATANGKRKWFGSFLTKDGAIDALHAALPALHGDFTRFA